jgi:hypothetical protein
MDLESPESYVSSAAPDIDYVSRGEFLPAMSRVAKEQGTENPIVTLQAVMPSFERMLDLFIEQGAMIEREPWLPIEQAEPGDITVVMNPFTIERLDELVPIEAVDALPFRADLAQWMRRYAFKDTWIADNAIASLLDCVCSGIQSRTGERRLRWTRQFYPECGRLPIKVWDAPQWLHERTHRAGAYGKECEKYFKQTQAEIKKHIQFRQGERFNFRQAALFAAKRFTGATWTEMAGGPARGRGLCDQLAGHSPLKADDYRKTVREYVRRTGLSMPSRAAWDASVN